MATSIFSSDTVMRQLFVVQGDNLWFGNSKGLFRYQNENEYLSIVKDFAITDIYSDENTIWAGTEKGLFYADLKYLNWRSYGKTEGLLSDTIVRVTSDMDYVYAAGPHSLSRLDKLVEQWEGMGNLSSTRIYDLYSDQDFLWVATGDGIDRFNKQYQKWEHFSGNQEGLSNKVPSCDIL